MNPLIVSLSDYKQLSTALQQQLYHVVTDETYKRGDFLLKAGQIDRMIWYIEYGLVIIYNDETGKVNWILSEGDYVIAEDSFETGDPTGVNILALEDTLTWCTTHQKLVETCDQHSDFNEHYRAIDGVYRKRQAIYCGNRRWWRSGRGRSWMG